MQQAVEQEDSSETPFDELVYAHVLAPNCGDVEVGAKRDNEVGGTTSIKKSKKGKKKKQYHLTEPCDQISTDIRQVFLRNYRATTFMTLLYRLFANRLTFSNPIKAVRLESCGISQTSFAVEMTGLK